MLFLVVVGLGCFAGADGGFGSGGAVFLRREEGSGMLEKVEIKRVLLYLFNVLVLFCCGREIGERIG